MSISKLRTAVIGLGRIGFGFHCPEVTKSAGFELVAVSDPLAGRLAEARAKWGVSGFIAVEPMLAEVKPELVVVASPTPFHFAQAEAGLRHGAHVFCDKPVVATVAEWDRLTATATVASRRIVAYQPARFHPEVRALRALLAAGTLGRIHLIRRIRANFNRRQDWQAFREHGGGMLNNYGSHCLDELLTLVSGAPIERVYCETRRVVTAGDAEDLVKALLTTADGLVIDLEISQASALAGPEWEVFGAFGAARWRSGDKVWTVRRFDPAGAPGLVAQSGLAAAGRLYQAETLPWLDEHVSIDETPFDVYAALSQHLAAGAPPPVPPAETRALLTLLERCRRSAETETVA